MKGAAAIVLLLDAVKDLELATEAARGTVGQVRCALETMLAPGRTQDDLDALADAFGVAYNSHMTDVALHRQALNALTALGLKLAPFAKVVQLPSTPPWQGPQ